MNRSVLKTINMESLLFSKDFDSIGFGCDWLTLSYSKPINYLDKFMFSVDDDNSNFCIIEHFWKEFTYQKILSSLWYALSFNYVYNWVSFPMFQYVKFNNQTKHITWRSAKISIYWSYFRLEEIWEFSKNYLITFINSFSEEDPKITRYDFRIDRFSKKVISIPEVENICSPSVQSRVVVWRQGWKLIDWGVWNKNTDRYYLRYYDKKIDTDNKNKRILYSDFMKYKSVHRFEIEFLSAFCRGYSLSDLKLLEDKIYSVLGLKDFEYNDSLFYKYDSDFEITPENSWKFIDRYINLSKKLLRAWYSPYQLIEESIIATYWKDVALWLLEDFLNNSLVYKNHETYQNYYK